jgi:hypothetical protein
MKGKTELIAHKVAGILREWKSVDCIALGEMIAEDFYDPYFFLTIDVYHKGPIPEGEARERSLSFGLAFESSLAKGKDRLIVDDVPVRIEYKSMQRIDSLVEGKDGILASMRNTGTYVFYRVRNSELLYDRSGWILSVRERLGNMPGGFWDTLRAAFQTRMEHCLNDMGAAAMRGDELFFLISLSNFIQSISSVLFAVNRKFEPSFRLFSSQVKALPVLPESFEGRFDSLLRTGGELPPTRKREVAEFLAKSILNL